MGRIHLFILLIVVCIASNEVSGANFNKSKGSELVKSNCDIDYLANIIVEMMSLVSGEKELSQLKELGVYDDIQYFYPKNGPSLDATLLKNKKTFLLLAE